MTNHNQHTEAIDSYLSGRMSESEITSFEEMIRTTPGLEEAVAQERIIINGIQQYRKAELKAHLASIDVAPSALGVGNGALLKAAIGGAVAIGMLTIAYLSFTPGEKSSVTGEVMTDDMTITIDMPQRYTKEAISLPIQPALNPAARTTSTLAKVALSIPPQDLTQKEVGEDAIEENIIPQISVPSVADPISEADHYVAEQVEDVSVSVPGDLEHVKVNKIFKKGVLQYKYFDGQLSLIGDFEKDTYEILEINSIDGKTLYLLYGNMYFHLDASKRVKDLQPITDQSTISDLNIIRSNKR
ncbi:MAG: hypothetical protein KI790_00780 [Cyclobacteriaceae bacterium]|nr:hypothetical protein [Cyclobacteriaceae bacterium HetDA_MAG_MS6]